MGIIDTALLPWFKAARFTLGLEVNESGFKGFYTGNTQRSSTLSDRLTGVLTIPHSVDHVEQGEREAVVFGMRSANDFLRMGLPQRRRNVGTLRGSPAVASNVLAGARSLTLQNATAGNNLLRHVDQMQTFLTTGWTLLNATLATNAITDPNGGNTGMQLLRTATGNHYGLVTATVASTALKTCTSVVWLKAGTLTGDVVLRLRDGAGTEIANVTVTPTSTWTPYWISGTFGGASAANVHLFVDPANDAGSAGDTLGVWFVDVRVALGFDTLCTSWLSFANPPSGLAGMADEVRRGSTSNAFTSWGYGTTSHALRTYTFSVWLKSGTYTGAVTLYLRDGAGVTVASGTVTPTASWQRYTVTGTFGASPAANIIVIVDPNDGGSIGETYQRYGVMLEPGSTPSDFFPWPTAAAGDVISTGGNLLHVGYAGAIGDASGAITVPLTLPAPKAITAGATVVTEGVTCLWELDSDAPQLDYEPGGRQGPIVLPLRQVIA